MSLLDKYQKFIDDRKEEGTPIVEERRFEYQRYSEPREMYAIGRDAVTTGTFTIADTVFTIDDFRILSEMINERRNSNNE